MTYLLFSKGKSGHVHLVSTYREGMWHHLPGGEQTNDARAAADIWQAHLTTTYSTVTYWVEQERKPLFN